MTKSNVESFYDDFSSVQKETGISKRNLKIQEWCEKFGMKPGSQVLEVGCGIGTQTELIANYLTNGKVTSIDISPKSVEIAKEHLKGKSNLELLVGDIITMNYTPKQLFDFIVLPDVIEHIPLDSHFKMFQRFRSFLKDSGSIIIHIPYPNYLEWCHTHSKDKLQVIDQPIYTDILCQNAYPNDLYIHYLETYEIWTVNGDYQIIVLKPKSAANHFYHKHIPPTFKQKLIYKLKLTFGLIKK
jgi:cyclopropane fatty-acyl-phospholipid synthase-like methyltransferase